MIQRQIKKRVGMTSGFIALMSVIIISAILLLVATSLSFSGFYARYNILDSEMKEKSLAIAEACADTALQKIANDSTYGPANEIVTIGGDFCTIQNVLTSGTTKTINVQTDYKNYFTTLRVIANTTNFFIISWEELP